MSSPLELLDRTPVTFVVLMAYVTLAFLTDPVSPSTESLIDHGAALAILVQDGEVWRLLSYAFLHGGILHLLFNGYFLFVFGPQIEGRLGSVRFILLYVITAVGGAIGGTLWNEPLIPLVGGSGALFGMFGAAIALFMREGRTHLDFLNYQGPRALLTLLVFNLVLGWLLPFVSNSAHIGGLISGFALTFCFLERGRSQPDRRSRVIQTGWIVLFAGLVLYCARPVLRWDYLYRKSLDAPTAAARRDYQAALARSIPDVGRMLRGLRLQLLRPVADLDGWDRGALCGSVIAEVMGERGEALLSSWRD